METSLNQTVSGQGRLRVTATIHRVGEDVLLTVTGGDRPHAGGVAVSLPRPSLSGDGKPSASTSVICVPGHKEDLLAREAGERAARRLGVTVVVVAGIHLDTASPEEIKSLQANALEAVEELLECARNQS